MLGRVPYKWIVATIFVVGLFMELMDTTVVNVALPTLARDLHIRGGGIEWVVTGYLLSLAVMIPVSGWAGDRFGTKRTFLFALVVFTASSMLCGMANGLPELVAFRVLQGVGGGMLTPVGTAMLFRAFPPAERARAATILMVPAVVAPATGPVVGGLLIDSLSWRWIFFVNVPTGVFGFLVGFFSLEDHREGVPGSFDVPGFVLSGGGLASILYALSEGPGSGWGSTTVVLTGALGVVLCAVLVVVETHVAHPMLMLRLYRDRMFRMANTVLGLVFASFAGLLFLLPLFLQGLQGLSALQSGLTTFPQAIAVAISAQLIGRVYPRVGPRRLIAVGMACMGLVTLAFAFVPVGIDLWWLRGLMFVRGLFMACALLPLQASAYANIEAPDMGRATAIYSAQRQTAAALGVAIVASVWLSKTNAVSHADIGGRLHAFHLAFAVTAGLLFLSAARGGLDPRRGRGLHDAPGA